MKTKSTKEFRSQGEFGHVSAIHYPHSGMWKEDKEILDSKIVCSCCVMAGKQLYYSELRDLLSVVGNHGNSIILLQGGNEIDGDVGVILRGFGSSDPEKRRNLVYKANGGEASELDSAILEGAKFVAIPGDACNHIDLSLHMRYKHPSFTRLDIASFTAIYYSDELDIPMKKGLKEIAMNLDWALSVLDLIETLSFMGTAKSLLEKAYSVAQEQELIEVSARLSFENYKTRFLLAVPIMHILKIVNQKTKKLAVHHAAQFIIDPEGYLNDKQSFFLDSGNYFK